MVNSRPLRIAILGTRGVPARYGGFETFAAELSTRLVARGHSVTVYGRRKFFRGMTDPEPFHGVSVRLCPTIMQKYLETPLHALTSFIDIIPRRFDVVLLCNAANSPFAWLCRIGRRKPLAINVDGIERNRGKWNSLGRAWYRLGEASSVWFADRVIADADVIDQYYRERYGCRPTVIAYGADGAKRAAGEVLAKFGLQPERYLLYVSRLEPENNALGVVQAYGKVSTDLPLVIVGDAPYAKEYIAEVKRSADRRVIFTGYQFGDAYRELQSNCYLYIQATEVGGTHPALVEAMAFGNCVIANGTPENIEVLGDAGMIYRRNDFNHLAEILTRCIGDAAEVGAWRARAAARAAARYDWERITDRYEQLFAELAG